MSGICGYVGPAPAGVLDAMLARIDYRGDRSETFVADESGIGYRWWCDRPGKSPGLFQQSGQWAACAGGLTPAVSSPAEQLPRLLEDPARTLADLDGAFAGAWWDGSRKRLTLIRDPFGVRSLYYVEHAGVFYFASELKQLLAIPGLPIQLDQVALHKYLTFSFVPGEDVPILGIRRLLPGHIATWHAGKLEKQPYFQLRESLDSQLDDAQAAVRLVRQRCRAAVKKRWFGEPEVGLYLSGGLDSSGVGVWLKEAGVAMRAWSLDFGAASVEKQQAAVVAERLGIPLEFVPVDGRAIAAIFSDLVWKLDLPFGDPVTGPQYLLGKAAREAGITAVFNGEGGDQFFGGWTNKPMISAQLYANLYGEDSREELYLKSYHRFYGFEDRLYTPEFRAAVGKPGQRRAHLKPYLESDAASTFLNRIRLADVALKGSQNILPRAERLANAWGLDLRVPLFDRELAMASFRLPPHMKLHGACEKYVLKLALKKHLPREIVWRRKFGMSVPITDWVLGPLAGTISELLGPESLGRRGLFQLGFVEYLRQGGNAAQEIRRRRIGERLWTLAMAEAWMRVFVDGRGQRPQGVV